MLLTLLSMRAFCVPPEEQSLQSTPNRYKRTVFALQQATAETRADFARSALRELTEAYIAEADLARNQAMEKGDSDKLLGWSRAVDQYAAQLLLLLEDIDVGFPAEVSAGGPGGASVSVAGRLVILTHPRANQQAAFEQRVLQDFCARHHCKSLTASAAPGKPIPLSGSQVQTRWSFEEEGPLCTYEGLALYFSSMDKLARSRSICDQLMSEAATLAGEIAWQRRHGVAVDWQRLEIRATPRRPEHLVVLNAAGDSILATLPLLHGNPAALADLKPWIDTRFSDGTPTAVTLQAAPYGWEDPEQ